VFQFVVLPVRRAWPDSVGQVSDLTVPGVSDSVDTHSGADNPGTSSKPGSTGSETPRTGRPEVCPTGARLAALARGWLRQGLEGFGLGAKTAAGYGWFDASEEFNKRFLTEQRERAETEAKRLKGEREAHEAIAKANAEKQERERQRSTLAPDDAWIALFKGYPETKRREVINKFAFDDEKWWPNEDELADERIQFSLLHFLVNVEPDFLSADRAKPSSKTAKAIAGLKRKFPSVAVCL
jgi:hypothetical protein